MISQLHRQDESPPVTAVATTIRANLDRVRERIANACARVGRLESDVQLVAVTKYAELSWVEELLAAGQISLGESRPQQLIARAEKITRPDIDWHLIGHLQRNKVRPVLPVASLIHSVDSLRLAQRINLLAGEMMLQPELLLEVNISGESSKDGLTADEVRSAWPQLSELRNLRIRGLMTMAPRSETEDAPRRVFAGLRHLRDELSAVGGTKLPVLSMGMSNDFEAAILEGATHVRIGSVLFDGLSKSL